MSKEVKGSIWGIKGKYTRKAKHSTLRPCEHLVIEKDRLFSGSIVVIHGKEDGSITAHEIKGDSK